MRATKQGLQASYEVTNTGRRTGTGTGTDTDTDTGQVYVTLPKSAGEPGKRLVAFKQVELRPGQHRQFRVTVTRSAADHPLSVWDTRKDTWTIPSGTFTVETGSSSADLPLKTTITLP
ncbi:fibronectin type III-like domain-contianing protein [Streptomyces sp. NPDC005827]|uniref:fibronectin type III-like domain-contianing protein n=1 Tax=Streptomyces sp. NPDC005827 TaxID=3157070 RepID=UPI00340E8D0C